MSSMHMHANQRRGPNCRQRNIKSRKFIHLPCSFATCVGIVGLVFFFMIACSNAFGATELKAMDTAAVPAEAASLQDIFSDAEISALLTSYGDNQDGPPGKFVHGRHGWTHYILDLPPSSADSKGLVVVCHGVLASSILYKEAADILASSGYTVLRYDFFGHGYSKWEGPDSFIEYHPDVFVDQLEDVLDAVAAVSQLGPEMVGFVGHSTGALVGIYAEERWRRTQGARHIEKLVLASPAIWAHKPLLAVLADRMPALVTFLMKNIPPLQGLVQDAVFVLSDETFAVDPTTGAYFHPEEKRRIDKLYNRLFGREKGVPGHPLLTGSFIGINRYILNAELLPDHGRTLERLLTSDATKVLLIWGNLDLTVPYAENIDIARVWEQSYNQTFQVKTVENLAHDLFLADTDAVMKSILPFLHRPS